MSKRKTVWAIIYTDYHSCEFQDEPDKDLLGIAESVEAAEKWLAEKIKKVPYNLEWIDIRSYFMIVDGEQR